MEYVEGLFHDVTACVKLIKSTTYGNSNTQQQNICLLFEMMLLCLQNPPCSVFHAKERNGVKSGSHKCSKKCSPQ